MRQRLPPILISQSYVLHSTERQRGRRGERERQNNKGHWHRLTEKQNQTPSQRRFTDDEYVTMMMIIMFEAVRECSCVCVCVCALEVCVFAWPRLSSGGLQHVGSCIVCRVLTLPPPPAPPKLFYSLLNKSNKLQPQLRKWPTRRVRTSPNKSEHANEPSKKKPKRANKISATELIKKL